MRINNLRITAVLGALALFLVTTVVSEAQAQSPLVNQEATQILQRMTDYLGSLKKFSVHTQNTVEDELATGNRVDYSIAADVIVKVRALLDVFDAGSPGRDLDGLFDSRPR